MRFRQRLARYAAVVVVAAGAGAFVVPSTSSAHGAMITPGSRTYYCYVDGRLGGGDIIPTNTSCGQAVNGFGKQPLWDWFAVLRSDSGGRIFDAAKTGNYIVDGQLCSGGNTRYGGTGTGYNWPSVNWPTTHLTAGQTRNIRYNQWAAHPGTWRLYITKNTWNPSAPLRWEDLETTPFSEVVNPPITSGASGAEYSWTATLPSGKTGRHLIYSVWTRSDSMETFYGCSDVVFDGGNGEVTGIGSNPSPGETLPGGPTAPPGTSTGCVAQYRLDSSWNTGFVTSLTVINTGTTPIRNWTVSWTFGNTETVGSMWSASFTQTDRVVTAQNLAQNGAIAPNSSSTFGFVGNSSGTTGIPVVTCTAG